MEIIIQGCPCKGLFACQLRYAAFFLCVLFTRASEKQSHERFSRSLSHGMVNIFACVYGIALPGGLVSTFRSIFSLACSVSGSDP